MLSQVLVAIAIAGQAGSTAADLKPYTSPKGKYTISMPTKPGEKKRIIAVAGKTVELVTATSRKGLATYATSHAELLGADSASAYKTAQDDVLAQSKGTLKEEKDLALGNQTGHELTIDIPRKVIAGGASQTTRIYVIGGRLYVVSATVSNSKAEALVDDVGEFFDSFKPQGVNLDAEAGADAPVAKTTTIPAGTTKIANTKGDQPKSNAGAMVGGLLNPFTAKKAATPAAGAAGAGDLPKGLGAEWKMVAFPELGISAALPGEPKELKINSPTPLGAVAVTANMVEAPKGIFGILSNGGANGVLIPDAVAEQVLDQTKAGVAKGFPGAKVLEEKKIKHLGFPGRDMVIEIPAGKGLPEARIMRLRLVIAKGKLIQLQAVTIPNDPKAASLDEITAYHNSLQFTEDAKK